jgi:hypothetical protein
MLNFQKCIGINFVCFWFKPKNIKEIINSFGKINIDKNENYQWKTHRSQGPYEDQLFFQKLTVNIKCIDFGYHVTFKFPSKHRWNTRKCCTLTTSTFHQNIAPLEFKNLIFCIFCPFFAFCIFLKLKKLTTLLDWYDITLILHKILIPYHALVIPISHF